MEFWRCRNNTIFCGGEFRPGLGLCTRCRTVRWKQRKGGSSRREVFKILREPKKGRRPSGGGALLISYNASLFQSRKRVRASYARVLYERVAKITLPADQKVVAWCSRGLPVFEQLVVVPNGSMNEDRLMAWLNR